jgi:hypothetical protein
MVSAGYPGTGVVQSGPGGARATAGEVPDRLQQVGGLALFEPGGGTVDAFGRLLRDLGGHAGLATLGGHLLQFVRHGAELVSGPLLLDIRLVAGVPAGLAGQVTRLARGLRYYFPGLVGGGLRDAAARLARGPADVRGLVPRDGGGRRLVLRAGTRLRVSPHVLGHGGPSFFLVIKSRVATREQVRHSCTRDLLGENFLAAETGFGRLCGGREVRLGL